MDLTFDDTFDISDYGGKLFKAEPIRLGTSWDIPGVKAATPEGKEVEKMVKALWAKVMDAFKKAREKEYKDILAFTEQALRTTAKKKGEELMKGGDRKAAEAALLKWLDEEAKGANVMIRNALTTFKGVAEKKMNELWAKIADAVDRKFKTTLRNAKIVAALKIAGLAIVIVAAAALTIAAGVLGALTAPTGVGLAAGVGLALGGIATIAAAAAKIQGVYTTHWPNHKTAAANLKKAAETLKEAIEYEEKKLLKTSQGASLGPKEKARLFFGNTQGKRAALAESIKAISVWTATMLQDVEKGGQAELAIEKQLQQLEKRLASEQDKKKAAELQKLCAASVKKIFDSRVARENTRLYLRRYAALTNEGAALLASEEKLSSAALGAFLARIQELANSQEMDTLIAVGKSGAEFLKALIAFQG
ncbi:MAG TPA: hypothetical protein VNS61_14785 [Caldimonas sp.]|nr:hypothetical protein [Caldimonas sp.]